MQNSIIDIPPTNQDVESNNVKSKMVMISISIILVMFMCIIGIMDLVYAYSGDNCLNEYRGDIHLNMKTYLSVSGLHTILWCFIAIFNLFLVNKNNELSDGYILLNVLISIFSRIFNIIWNLVGFVVFFNFVYPSGSCVRDLSTYVYVTLTIKLAGDFITVYTHKCK